MRNLSLVGWISFVLVIIGGINWGLVGLANINVVSVIFGDFSLLARLVYILVGLGALYLIYAAIAKRN